MSKIALFVIGLYRRVSPLFPARCKHVPSCSDYACQAFSRYPFVKAAWLSFWRIIRCNPVARGGFDPLN